MMEGTTKSAGRPAGDKPSDTTTTSWPGVSRGEVTRSLRAFTLHQGLWGAWSQMAGLSTAVMTGYALWLGADAAAVALLSSVIAVMALAQPLAPLIGARFKDQKRFILNSRMVAVVLRGSILAIPFVVPEDHRLLFLVVILCASLLLVQLSSPYIGSWQSNIIPRGIRARFTGRATILATILAMVMGIGVGTFLDAFSEANKQIGFASVFAASILLGWITNRALGTASYPRANSTAERLELRVIAEPLCDPNFKRAMLFAGSSQFALGLAAPFFSVFMLQHLNLSYTTISLFTAVNMIASIVGYRVWAGPIDRFGGKPVLQLLLGPYAAVPLLWVFIGPDTYWLIPVAFTVGGFVGAGVGIGITPLMFDLLPQGSKKPLYLAVWSATVSLIYGLGPLLGSFLSRILADVHIEVLATTVKPIQIIFFCSAVAGIVPMLLLPAVRDNSVITPCSLLRQMSTGNLLRYLYNSAVYRLSSNERRRACATLALGKSQSPLAVEHLVQAMRDASSEVRRQAAYALGESGSREAINYLARELRDRSSDIRSAAAEALGRLGMPDGIESLIDCLDDDDPRVVISAIRALAEIKGEEVQELLFWHLTNDFKTLTFPTLVDVLGNMGDPRIVMTALRNKHRFRSHAIRLQLLNAAANGLGARGKFYKLIAHDEHRRVAIVKRILKSTSISLTGASCVSAQSAEKLGDLFAMMTDCFDAEDVNGMENAARKISALVREEVQGDVRPAGEARVGLFAVLQALDEYLRGPATAGDTRAAHEILLAICLNRLAAYATETNGVRGRV